MTLVAAEHVRLLAEAGHDVAILGAHTEVLAETLPVTEKIHVPATGTGALYSPPRVDRHRLAVALRDRAPDLVLVEAWQTALTDAAIDVAADMGIPVVMLSHGISVHPYTSQLTDVLRGMGWLWYRWVTLPRRMRRLSALAVLDQTSTSPRFFDRNLAQKLGVPVMGITNSPIHWRHGRAAPSARKRQILVVGYFSPVKNQLAALQVLEKLPADVAMCFIGRRAGRYYDQCVALTKSRGLQSRVRYLEDDECDLAGEIAESLIVLSTSKTEVLPLTLLEAMASGTPFVATPVGAVPSLAAGLIADGREAQYAAIMHLISDTELWERKSQEGRLEFERHYTREAVRDGLLKVVEFACGAPPVSASVSRPQPTPTGEGGP